MKQRVYLIVIAIAIAIATLISLSPVFGQDGGSEVGKPETGDSPVKISSTELPSGESGPGDTIPGLDVRSVSSSKSSSADRESPDVNSLKARQSVEGSEGGAGVIEETEGGYWLKDAPLNEVFQYLAQRASMQFFYTTNLSGPEFLVTGQLLDAADPVIQMEELGLMYEVTIHKKGNTVYALVP